MNDAMIGRRDFLAASAALCLAPGLAQAMPAELGPVYLIQAHGPRSFESAQTLANRLATICGLPSPSFAGGHESPAACFCSFNAGDTRLVFSSLPPAEGNAACAIRGERATRFIDGARTWVEAC